MLLSILQHAGQLSEPNKHLVPNVSGATSGESAADSRGEDSGLGAYRSELRLSHLLDLETSVSSPENKDNINITLAGLLRG